MFNIVLYGFVCCLSTIVIVYSIVLGLKYKYKRLPTYLLPPGVIFARIAFAQNGVGLVLIV